jgi:hypothetical protein
MLRLRYWICLFKGPRKTCVLFSEALFAVWAVRDEFLSPERARQLKMPKWLPDWPWYVWVIVILVTIISFLLEGSYREFKKAAHQMSG